MSRRHAPARPRPRRSDAGVTLVEVLVVLVLIGTVAGAVGLSLGALDRGADPGQEARLLAARLNRAADEALIAAAPVAFLWTDRSYRFEVRRDGEWAAHPVAILGTTHDLGAGLSLTAPEAEGRVVVGPDLLPDGGVLGLAIASGPDRAATVAFDGATAVVGEGT